MFSYFHETLLKQNLLTDLGSPEGVAIDHLSRTVFWTDSVKDRIEVASLDGSQRRVIVDSELVNPRAIITDPSSGCVFKGSPRLGGEGYALASGSLWFSSSQIRLEPLGEQLTEPWLCPQQQPVLDRLEPRRAQDRDLLHGRDQQEGPGEGRPRPAQRPDL